MFNNHKKSNFIILSVAFITTFGFQNTASAKLILRRVNSNLETQGIKDNIFSESSFLSLSNSNSFENYGQKPLLANNSIPELEVQSQTQPSLDNSSSNSFGNSDDSSLADTLLNSFTDRNSAEKSQNNPEISPVVKIVQKISLLFFLLLFVPLGLFYPLFLFYKKLLTTDFNYDDSILPPEDFEPPFSDFPLDEDEVEPEAEDEQASISQLQIAFSPQALKLRCQLEEITANTEMQRVEKIAELMRQTIGVLIAQKHWTHVNNSSSFMPVQDIRREFELAFYAEKDKCLSRELTLINKINQPQQKPDVSSDQNFYNYMVVTLIFATSQGNFLAEQIHTQEHLTKELSKLGRIHQDDLIDFEVLWNPRQEGYYINNEQLLMDYGNMVRLF